MASVVVDRAFEAIWFAVMVFAGAAGVIFVFTTAAIRSAEAFARRSG